MIWHMQILKICLGEQILRKYYMIKHLILLKILQWFISFFDKKHAGGAVKNEVVQNEKLAEELHKPIIRKFEEQEVQSYFTDNSWCADLPDMQLLNKI